MTFFEYFDKVYFQLALQSGFSFAPEAGPIPRRAVVEMERRLNRNRRALEEGFEANVAPDVMARRLAM